MSGGKKLRAKLPTAFLVEPDPTKDQFNDMGKGVFSGLNFALSSMQGWRPGQEDAHCHLFPSANSPKVGFLGVFDGHGGENASKYVAKTVPTFIENSGTYQQEIITNQNFDPEVVKQATIEGFYSCDDTLRKSAQFKKPTERSGCTGVFCTFTEKNIIVANTGDSRAVLVRGATDVWSTFDQKPDQPEEKARIEAAGLWVQYGRIKGDLAVARSFGDYRFKSPKLHPSKTAVTVHPEVTILWRDPSEDQLLILACDGIWDVMSNLECANFVLAGLWMGLTTQEVADMVLDECLRKGSGDNMSIIVVAMEQAPQAENKSGVKPSIDDVRRQMARFAL